MIQYFCWQVEIRHRCFRGEFSVRSGDGPSEATAQLLPRSPCVAFSTNWAFCMHFSRNREHGPTFESEISDLQVNSGH